MTPRRHDWILTRSGRVFFPLSPRAGDVAIEDIAHGLAIESRWGNQCEEPFSVAQHCVHASEIAEAMGLPRGVQFAALLHDASEAYLGDMVSPMKRFMPDYKTAERGVEAVIYEVFGVSALDRTHPAIKTIDLRLRRSERDVLMPRPPDGYQLDPSEEVEPWPGLEIVPWPWRPARDRFLERFADLKRLGRTETV